RQQNGITLRGLSQPTFATKSAHSRLLKRCDEITVLFATSGDNLNAPEPHVAKPPLSGGRFQGLIKSIARRNVCRVARSRGHYQCARKDDRDERDNVMRRPSLRRDR